MPRYTSLFDDLDVLRALAQAVGTEVPTVRGQPIEYTDMLPAEYGKPDARVFEVDPTTPSPSRDPQREQHLLMVKQLLTDLLAQAQDKPKVSDFSSLKDVIAFLQAHQITNAAGQPIVDASGNVKDQAGLAAYIKQYAQTAEQAGGFVGNQMKAHMQTIMAELNQAPQLGEAARELAGQPAQPQQGQQPAGGERASTGDNQIGSSSSYFWPFDSTGEFNIRDLQRWPTVFAPQVSLSGSAMQLNPSLMELYSTLQQDASLYLNAFAGTGRDGLFGYDGASPDKELIKSYFLDAFGATPGASFRAAQAALAAFKVITTFENFFTKIHTVAPRFAKVYQNEIAQQITIMANLRSALMQANKELRQDAGKAAQGLPSSQTWGT